MTNMDADQTLRLETLSLAVTIVNHANLAMAASDQAPWIPTNGTVEKMADGFFNYVKDGSTSGG